MRFLVLAALTLLSLVDLTTAWTKTRVESDFQILDLDRNDKISKDEGQKFMDLTLNKNEERRKNFWEVLDSNRDGEITRDEFSENSLGTEIIIAAFKLFDTDEDEYVTLQECKNIIASVSDTFFGTTWRKERWLDSFYQGVDQNNNGKVDYDEFYNFMVARQRSGPKTEYQEEFELLDIVESGFLSRQEIQRLMFELKGRSSAQTRKSLGEVMAIMDINKNGMVEDIEYVMARGSCKGLKDIFKALVPADREDAYLTKGEILELRNGGFHIRINADNVDRLDRNRDGRIVVDDYLNFMGLLC